MRDKIKSIELMLIAMEFKCIELCRETDTGISNPYGRQDTKLVRFQDSSYIMFKDDADSATLIMRYVLGVDYTKYKTLEDIE